MHPAFSSLCSGPPGPSPGLCCCLPDPLTWLLLLQGRVAADIQSGDELVLTEMIFSGAFNELTPEQLAAVTSAFVWQEKGDKAVHVRGGGGARQYIVRGGAKQYLPVCPRLCP